MKIILSIPVKKKNNAWKSLVILNVVTFINIISYTQYPAQKLVAYVEKLKVASLTLAGSYVQKWALRINASANV